MIRHCELMGDRVAVLDPPPGLDARQVVSWRTDDAGYDSAYAALYWPWVQARDPATGTDLWLPPSGHVAGVWARSDSDRGVQAAPVGDVRGASAVQVQTAGTQQDLLAAAGINTLRSLPGRGVRVWGARTLSSEPGWRYLSVRRYLGYLEESVRRGTRWSVFEPGGPELWERLRDAVAAFLLAEWRRGALPGTTPDQAFFVTCDATTNPPEAVAAGSVTCSVGVAVVRPGEFLVFGVTHRPGDDPADRQPTG
jgi:phage tail sheath protein FI